MIKILINLLFQLAAASFLIILFFYLSSLQGPLVTKSSGKWTVTQVVDYFHLLPYAGIMSDWLSRCVAFLIIPSFWEIKLKIHLH